MSLLLMSFLLLVLIGLGLFMGTKSVERFTDVPIATIAVSPALANIVKTPDLIKATSGPLKVDTLARDVDAVTTKEHKCPDCPVCPDMSQYVRLDEVPCWNCTLP